MVARKPPRTAILRLRTGPYLHHCVDAGWYTLQAQGDALGLHPGTVSRVVHDLHEPGPAFVAGALRAFPELDFGDLFEIIDRPDGQSDEQGPPS